MSGLTRQEMKRDEVREGLLTAVDWISENVQKILIGIGAVIVLLIAFSGLSIWRSGRAEAAQMDLAAALRAVGGAVVESGADPDNPQAPTFESEEARRAKARELLEAIPGNTVAGEIASVYLGDLAAEEGNFDEARARWERFVDKHERHTLAAVVETSLISLDRQLGNTEAIVTRLQQMEQSGSGALPRDVLLFELGSSQEALDRVDEAGATFKTLVEEFPQSPYAAQARTRPSYVASQNQALDGLGG